jgi:hypothetical protein
MVDKTIKIINNYIKEINNINQLNEELNDLKNIIKIIGGDQILKIDKLSLNNYSNLNKDNIMELNQNKIISNYEKDDDIKEILQNQIILNYKKATNIHGLFLNNKYNTMIEIGKNNNIYIKAKNELNDIFNWLILLDTVSLDTIINLKFKDDYKVLNGFFIVSVKNAYLNKEKYEKFSDIVFENMNGFYIGWLISIFFRYCSRKDIEFYEYLYPNIFLKYKIKHFYNLIYYLYVIDEDEQ